MKAILFKFRLLFHIVLEMGVFAIFSSFTLSFFLIISLSMALFAVTTIFIFRHQFQQTMVNFYQQELTNYQEISEHEIAFWQQVSTFSQTRDVYVNLARLYEYVDNQEKYQENISRAKQLDPNNQQF